MKLIIAGSRSIRNYDVVREAIIQSGLWAKHKRSIEVVCGMAKGVDLLGKEFAEKNGLVLHKYPADWDDIKAPGAVIRLQASTGLLYNAVAGHWRNQLMADVADALLLVWDGKSTGSKDMFLRAEKKGLEIHAFIYSQDQLTRIYKL